MYSPKLGDQAFDFKQPFKVLNKYLQQHDPKILENLNGSTNTIISKFIRVKEKVYSTKTVQPSLQWRQQGTGCSATMAMEGGWNG